MHVFMLSESNLALNATYILVFVCTGVCVRVCVSECVHVCVCDTRHKRDRDTREHLSVLYVCDPHHVSQSVWVCICLSGLVSPADSVCFSASLLPLSISGSVCVCI